MQRPEFRATISAIGMVAAGLITLPALAAPGQGQQFQTLSPPASANAGFKPVAAGETRAASQNSGVLLPPPDLPPVHVAFPGLTPKPAADTDTTEKPNAATPDIPPPDLPPVVVSFPQAPKTEPNTDKSADVVTPVLLPPDLPPVVVKTDDYLDGHTVLADELAKGDVLVHARIATREKRGIAAFYKKRGNRTAWLDGANWTPAAQAIIAQLRTARDDGLDPADYAVPELGAPDLGAPDLGALPADNRDLVLADADIRLSVAAVAYARDARGARFNPARLGKQVTPDLDIPAAQDVLDKLASAPDAGAALAAYQPQQAGYKALKAKLAELRAKEKDTPQVRVPPGRPLRVGMSDPRVPLVRVRFGLDSTDGEKPVYDKQLAAAVADFQKEHGLPANGILNGRTISVLDGASTKRAEDEILVNMERWRWLPQTFGSDYILVNIPEFKVRVFKDHQLIHEARVITGKPATPTPIFSNSVKFVIVNPSWHVPESIIKKEFLPKMTQDPNYPAEHGYEVTYHKGLMAIRQPPGPRNALGRIKFLFPNQHSVYMHDTPQRYLFAKSYRAFSHGCVRVHDPFSLAEALLGKDKGWPESRIKKMIGTETRTIRLPEPIPIHIVYFTASVDDNGDLILRDDLYGYDRDMMAAPGLTG